MVEAFSVILPLPLKALSYLAPLNGAQISPGQRVVVPWQGGAKVGIVGGKLAVDSGSGLELRHTLGTLEEEPWLESAALEALNLVAAAVGSPVGAVLQALNPPGLLVELQHEVFLLDGAAGALKAAGLEGGSAGAGLPLPATGDWLTVSAVPLKTLEFLRGQGLVDERVTEKVRTRRVLVAREAPEGALKGSRREGQRVAHAYLTRAGEAPTATGVAAEAGVSVSSVRSLISRGLAAYEDAPEPAPPHPLPPTTALAGLISETTPGSTIPSLSCVLGPGTGLIVGGSQAQRLTALRKLLATDLSAGHSVVVLASEHAEAAQAAAFLQRDLPVSYLTGEASEHERVGLWRDLKRLGPRVLVGTYLALLAPVKQLGRVVLLSAGSSAYKLHSGARLMVSKAARTLAAAAAVPLTLVDLVVGPELDLLAAPDARLTLPLPDIRLHVADLSSGAGWPLHTDLVRTLKQVVQRERQAVILAPRRGYSAAYGCTSCGWQVPCPNCDLTLRYHRYGSTLRCHQCGYECALPVSCEECGALAMDAISGAGTQWIATRLREMFPAFPVHRYDRDRRDDLAPLYAGEPGIVVGTLAVLGLQPLPNLSLIGVTHFDTHLAAADFRAEEEATRMLLRLAALATSRRPLMIVQAHSKEHPLLAALASEDPGARLEEFLRSQLERRERFGYPPYSALAKLQFSSADRASAYSAAEQSVNTLLTWGATTEEVLGPASAPVERVRARYVFHVLLRAESEQRLTEFLTALPRSHPRTRLIIDVDPQEVGAFIE